VRCWRRTSTFSSPKSKPVPAPEVVGHNGFTYRIHPEWGKLDSSQTPVNNCHEMVMDSKGRLIMVTDEPKNNIIIYDKSGKLLKTWGTAYPGGHGLSLFREGGEDMLFISDPNIGRVDKTTVEGETAHDPQNPARAGHLQAGRSL
jgi:hypothetical protein